MNKILFLAFLFFGCLSAIAQKEVCESEEYKINDFNSINKCVIMQKEDNEKKVYSTNKSVFLRKRFKNKVGITVASNVVFNKEKKVSAYLINKLLLIKEEIDEGALNNAALNK